MSEFDDLKIDRQICHRLYTLSNGLTRLYRPMLEQLDLTYPQYLVMLALWEKDQISIKELNKKTRIDKGFLTSLLDKLQSKKLISLIADSSDKRSKNIRLLSKGQKLKLKAKSIPQQVYCQFKDVLEADQYKNLIDQLDKLINSLKS